MRGLIKFVKLPAPEQRFFLRAVVLLGYYRLALLVTPLQRLLKQLPNRPAPVVPKHRLDAPRMARLVKAAGSLVPGATCLSNSLAGQHLFAGQKGIGPGSISAWQTIVPRVFKPTPG